jgi:hypothetical protein
MKKRSLLRRILLVAGLVLVLLVGWVGLEIGADLANIILPWHRQNAIEAACAWGGLAPLPEAATDLKVSTGGSSFTRSFHITFKAPAEAIVEWVNRSKRLRDARPQTDGDLDRYEIKPGEEKAFGGWVEIDRAAHCVVIEMSWS